MIKGLVSVIIPCYNQGQFLSEALESLLAQTYTDWECTIVDDGSIDHSGEIALQFCSKDNRFRYLRQGNKGVSAARNAGFRQSQGEFIQFLDGDDYLLPEKFATQMQILKEHPETDIVYCSYTHYYVEKKLFETYTFRDVSEKPLEAFLFHWDREVSLPIHSPLFRRKLWERDELPFPSNDTRYEDWIFWVRLSLKNGRFYFYNIPQVIYRIHHANFCSDSQMASLNMLEAAICIRQIIPDELKDQFWDKTVNYILDSYHNRKELEMRRKNFIIKIDRKRLTFLRYLLPSRIRKIKLLSAL